MKILTVKLNKYKKKSIISFPINKLKDKIFYIKEH